MSSAMPQVICGGRQRLPLDILSNRRMGIAETITIDDPEIRSLAEAMDARGLRRSDLARHLGLDASQVTRIFDGRRRVQRHEWRKLQDWLGRPFEEREARGDVALLPGMVPLYGWTGAASDDRLTAADQTLLGAVLRHPAQANVQGAYALQVQGDSMVPRYEPGETVFLAPNQWPAKGQDCVLVTRDGYSFLKRFSDRRGNTITLSQFNPTRELSFDAADIAAVHAVVGRS